MYFYTQFCSQLLLNQHFDTDLSKQQIFISYQLFKQLVPAPLDAESVFFGGDYWLTLFAQSMAPPKQSKRKQPIKTCQCLYQIIGIGVFILRLSNLYLACRNSDEMDKIES